MYYYFQISIWKFMSSGWDRYPESAFARKRYDSCIEHAVRHSNCYSNMRWPCSTWNKSKVWPACLVRFQLYFLQDQLYPGDTFFMSVTAGFSLLFVLYGLAFTGIEHKWVLILVWPPSVAYNKDSSKWRWGQHDDNDDNPKICAGTGIGMVDAVQ